MVWSGEAVTTDTLNLIDLKLEQPNPARIYNYLLGGKDHYALDRQAADLLARAAPDLVTTLHAGRRFMHRAARYLAGELGIRQFLDVGTGIPFSPNLHEVVQLVAPGARVVYVDNDPVVLTHARALLTGTPAGVTACVDADLRRPDMVLSAPQLLHTLDLDQPVAITLLVVLDVVPDDRQARRIIASLLEPWPAGSALAVSTVTADTSPDQAMRVRAACQELGLRTRHRSRHAVRDLFAGLQLQAPDVVPVHRWRPDPSDPAVRDDQVLLSGGVAIKP